MINKDKIVSIEDIIEKVKNICIENNVEHLYLFGSYAKGIAQKTSDIDFIVKGVKNIDIINEKINEIETLKRIDLFDYDNINNQVLKESMDKYGKIIY